jgi:hypothetical protein
MIKGINCADSDDFTFRFFTEPEAFAAGPKLKFELTALLAVGFGIEMAFELCAELKVEV